MMTPNEVERFHPDDTTATVHTTTSVRPTPHPPTEKRDKTSKSNKPCSPHWISAGPEEQLHDRQMTF
jgi:hypothetical protein